MARPSSTGYLMKQLNDRQDFTTSWTKLTDADKATLRQWAEQEMDALGM